MTMNQAIPFNIIEVERSVVQEMMENDLKYYEARYHFLREQYYREFGVKNPGDYWIVWCKERGAPTKRYSVYADAVKESERLAKQHPGHKFWVLKSVAWSMAEVTPVEHRTINL